jgi:RNA polymerase sigma-70 factor (ECF subfamily)
MLGSVFEAEDAVQETMLRAWRGSSSFEGRASQRTWVYRIATNVCVDMLRARSRSAVPMDLGPSSPVSSFHDAPDTDRPWLTPVPTDPGEAAAARETVRLAFVAALQHLPPRQRAVLILRDVLAWSSAEVAALLDTSAGAVNALLNRARATLSARPRSAGSCSGPVTIAADRI